MANPIIIIGGGLSGLYAGYLLQQRQFEFKIYEAASRLGGRIFGAPHPSDANNHLMLDLGPTWFWPHQTEMIALTKTLQLEYFEQYHHGEALFQADVPSPIERFLPSYLESFRLAGGMQQLIDRLASELPDESIVLNSAVTRIEMIDGVWQLSFDNPDSPDFGAEKLIIAAPPRVIADRLKMPDQALLALKNHLVKVPTWMAAQAKFVAAYQKPFWRELGLSGQAFSRHGPMVEIHDASAAINDGFALFGFIGVPASERKDSSPEALKQACLAQLVKIFGEQAGTIKQCYLTDWSNFKYIATDADLNEQANHPYIDLTPYHQILIDNGLYFAASEVATLDPGYLRGALVAASDAVGALMPR